MNVSVKLVLLFLRRDIIPLISENPQFVFHKVLHFINTENVITNPHNFHIKQANFGGGKIRLDGNWMRRGGGRRQRSCL